MRIKCLRVPEWRSQKETKESRSIATPLSSKDVRFGQETFSNSLVRWILAVPRICKRLTCRRRDSSFGAEESNLMICETGLAGFFEEPISPSCSVLYSTHFSDIYCVSKYLLVR